MATMIKDNRHYTGRLKHCIEVAENTFEATFHLENSIEYIAGQYIWLELGELLKEDPKGSRRAFSLINPPQPGQTTIQILFRKSESGFKQTLLALPKNRKITVIGPFGVSFKLQKELQCPLTLISGGVGIAPFLCIIRRLLNQAYTETVHLYHYENTIERIPYQEELDEFSQKRNTTFVSIKPFQFSDLSQNTSISHSLFLISGPQAFIDHVSTILKANGIKPPQLFFEQYYPTTPHESFFTALIKQEEQNQHLSQSMTENKLFRTALDSSSNHIVITDTRGMIYYANKAAEKNTGFTLKEMLQNTPRLWGGLMSPEFYEKLWHRKKIGIANTTEITNRKKKWRTL